MIDSKEFALRIAQILDAKGANNIEILEVGHLTSITDYFVIADGRNVQAVHSLAEDLEDKLCEEGIEPRRKDGDRDSKWIVMDYAQVIVHIFHPDQRKFYNIERLWEDGTNAIPMPEQEKK